MSFELLPPDLAATMRRFTLSGVAGQTAWRRSDALRVIEWLSAIGFAAVGGDVVVLGAEGPAYTYDNWSTPWSPGQPWDAYVARANRRAAEEIRRYPEAGGNDYYYVLACASSSSDLLMGTWLE